MRPRDCLLRRRFQLRPGCGGRLSFATKVLLYVLNELNLCLKGFQCHLQVGSDNLLAHRLIHVHEKLQQ